MDQTISIWFESIRNGFLDAFFLIITEFGDELVFLIISSVLYWLVNKDFGYRFMMIFLTTIAINDVLKNIIARPRPWEAGVVSVVGEGSYGLSMPSGHAQGSMTMALVLHEKFGKLKKWVPYLLFSIAILVSISRVYLGQHYLTDVIAGIGVSFVVYYAFIKLAPKVKLRPQTLVYYVAPLLLVLLFFVQDKNYFVSVSAMIGLTIGYDLEKKYINYDIKAPWKTQVLKYALGLGVALLLKEGLKMVLPYTTDLDTEMTLLDLFLDFIRYFILVLWLSFGSFWVFSKLFKNKKEVSV